MNPNEAYGPVSMGTTLIAIKYNGGVIMASDTWTTRGTFIADRAALKLNEISPSIHDFGSIKVMRCGNAAHSQMVSRMVKNYLTMHAMELPSDVPLSLDTVLNLYKTICYNNKNYLSAAYIITDGKQIASVGTSGAIVKHDAWASYGSGSTYVDGFVKSHIRKDLSYIEATELAIKAVSLAIDSDGSSGGNVRIVDVKYTGETKMDIVDNSKLLEIIAK